MARKIKLKDEYVPLEPEYHCKECGKKITKTRFEENEMCTKCYQDYLNEYGLFENE
jgi:predicted Zn-ribbon and HTH transcriptional regulator